MASVLIVEDDPFATRRLCRLLMSRGVSQIMHAATVARALELLKTLPDWVILDMGFPDSTGLVVLEAIRKADRPIRVIVLSVTNDAALLAACESYKPVCIIPKPLDPALLPI